MGKVIRDEPTLENIKMTLLKRGFRLNDVEAEEMAEEFFNYYESIGWMRENGTLIKQWKSALIDWHNKRAERRRKIIQISDYLEGGKHYDNIQFVIANPTTHFWKPGKIY